MKNLIYKELHLGLNKAIYISLLFVFILLIPNYPVVITFAYLFTMLPNFVFSFASSNRDYEYSQILPVRKNEYVKSKLFDFIFIEVIFLLLSIPILFIRNYVLYSDPSSALYYIKENSLSSIPTMYSITLISYSLANLIGMKLYFKSMPKHAGAILLSIFGEFIIVTILGIALPFIPNSECIYSATGSMPWLKIIILIISMLFSILSTYLTYRTSLKELNKH